MKNLKLYKVALQMSLLLLLLDILTITSSLAQDAGTSSPGSVSN